jgi:hypothetical protein
LKGGENLESQAFTFKTSYTTKLNPQAIDNYTEFLASIGIPSSSKLGCVFDIVHAYPMINGNGAGFTVDVLRNSAMSFLNSLIDINHDRNYIVGSIVKVDLIENDTSPLTVRLVGVLDKQILKDWGIEDLINDDWSMECLFNEYVYSIGGKIYKPEDIPDIDKKFNNIADGEPIFDQKGNRVNILLGGINGTVDFNRCGLIIWGQGADPLAETHLQVANLKNQKENNNKGSENMPFKQFETEADWKAAEAEIKNNYKVELKLDELQTNLQNAQASLTEKDSKITELSSELETTKASLTEVTERANKAEGELEKQAQAKLVEDRKQVLASKNYELDEEDNQFIATASQEDFDKFVKRIEKVQASTTKILEAKASQLGHKEVKEVFASLNLTGKTSDNDDGYNKNESTNILL